MDTNAPSSYLPMMAMLEEDVGASVIFTEICFCLSRIKNLK